MLHTMLAVLVLIALLLHLHVVGVDDGRGEVNQGVQFVFVAAPDLVVVLDVDKIRAFHVRNLERFYIIDGVHRSETVAGGADKLGETLARPCGKVEVLDEDVMSHAQLGTTTF